MSSENVAALLAAVGRGEIKNVRLKIIAKLVNFHEAESNAFSWKSFVKKELYSDRKKKCSKYKTKCSSCSWQLKMQMKFSVGFNSHSWSDVIRGLVQGEKMHCWS